MLRKVVGVFLDQKCLHDFRLFMGNRFIETGIELQVLDMTRGTLRRIADRRHVGSGTCFPASFAHRHAKPFSPRPWRTATFLRRPPAGDNPDR